MTKKRITSLFMLMLVVSLFAAACGDDEEATTTAAGEGGNGVLEVGTVLPETGDLAFLGPPMIEAVDMAVEDINAAGGVLGQPLALSKGDSGTNEDTANALVDGHLAAGVDAIVGAASSRITLSVIDKITGAQVVECSPSNTGADLTVYPDDGYYVRTPPSDVLQGQILGDLIVEDGYSQVAVIALNDAYGQGLADSAVAQVEENGATVVANVAYDPNGTVFDADVQQVADAAPDAVLLVAFPDTGGLIMQAMIEQSVGPADVAVYVTDGLQTSSLYEKIDPNDPSVTAGIRGTAPSYAPPGGAAFFADAFAAFAPGTDTIFAAYAYDCPVIIALAAEVAGTDDPTVFVDEINGVTRDGTKCDTYASCLALVADGVDIDYDGASGVLDFVDAGEPGAGYYDVYTFGADGNYTIDETRFIN